MNAQTASRYQAAVTLCDTVVVALETADRHSSSEVSPACILWTDARGEWLPLVTTLKQRLPQLLVFGDYIPERRTGPAIWLKCAIERCLPELALPEDRTPILYLPHVNRQDLRAGIECPAALQPLVELLYRGTVWTQKNGRDWTVEAMLTGKEPPGLGLDIAGDKKTRLSMAAALTVLGDTPVASLRGRRLEAEDFDRLMIGDHPRDLLRWLSDPETVRQEMDEGCWHAFCSRCREDYGFDPQADGPLLAAEKLGLQENGNWEKLWGRFEESPATYIGLPELLRRAKPTGRFDFERRCWPDENEQDEEELRRELVKFDTYDRAHARGRIEELHRKHEERRSWVWANLGQAPLALALEHLVRLAEMTKAHLGGDSPEEMAKLYTERGYLADDAALSALAAVKTMADCTAVNAAVRTLYFPWLDEAAKRLQELWTDSLGAEQAPVAIDSGGCILFADGLRFDLAQRLASSLEERGLRIEQARRWAALPSVTATAKPAVSPIAERITGRGLPDSFAPELAVEDDKSLTFARMQGLLRDAGYQTITTGEVGDPAAKDARGWCEFGDIDRRGHSLQIKLASIIDEQIALLVERILELLDAGWREVRVVTDHGWLLMPGGLPKEDLPHYLTEAKWARCATIKGESKVSVPTFPWFWNRSQEFATGRGVKCFSAGHCYAHGGVSLQECLIAELSVTTGAETAAVHASIENIDWKRLRCRITVAPVTSGLTVDLRSKPNDAGSSVAGGGKPLDGSGTVSLIVAEEDLQGAVVAAVVCDAAGRLVAKQNTTIGGE